MKIVYLYHSGIYVELDRHVLVFDYYRGEIPAFPDGKKVYIFSSHRHFDHFTKRILEWKELTPSIEYILSSDIGKRRMKWPENTTFIDPDQELQPDAECKVKTLPSTDEGVAFCVECEGRSLYHSGDLNWWHWEEEGREFNDKMRKDFQDAVGRVEGTHFDAAFFPLDKRLMSAYCLGLDWFMRHTDTDRIYPMHFWKHYGICKNLLQEECTKPYRERIQEISGPMECFWQN